MFQTRLEVYAQKWNETIGVYIGNGFEAVVSYVFRSALK